jgi:hypothetical protein
MKRKRILRLNGEVFEVFWDGTADPLEQPLSSKRYPGALSREALLSYSERGGQAAKLTSTGFGVTVRGGPLRKRS